MEHLRELIENKKYADFRKEIVDYNVQDVADFIEEYEKEVRNKLFRMLPKSLAADVFSYVDPEVQQEMLSSMSEIEAGHLIDNLFADDATDLLEEMPAGVVKRLLAQASPQTRKNINHLLNYPEDSAGSLMTVEFVDLKENLTVAQAIDRIRKIGIDKETINVCYVLDANRVLIGTVALRYLLLCEPEDVIGNIMHENVITIHTLDDQEEVAKTFQKYDFTAMPVVDSEDRLVGIITVDDVVDIMEQEATEDIEMMAAITPTDKPYMRTSVWETYKKRIPWLLLLMISATFTGRIIQNYEEAIAGAGYLVLTAFIPMLMDTGGNCGSQASVSVIRSLSLDEIEFKDLFKVIFKEIRVALLCGLTLAAANFLKLLLLDQVSFSVASVVCITLLVTVFVAKIVGSSLPLLAKKVGFDPAVMASPFITTIVDALSLMIYFSIATELLGL
ncbi:MAG: magnesium transporter [Lachnospiraceae bacterium]|nr:magnesium transporter [Lachnospiraceae bacterium]